MQQKSIREGNIYFPMDSIWISQSSVDTIRKLDLIGKIALYIIFQG